MKICKVFSCTKEVPPGNYKFCSKRCQRNYHDDAKLRNKAAETTALLQQVLRGQQIGKSN